MPLPVGTTLGRYEIRSPIGKGGMGEVYLAYDSSLRRQVAVKLLPAEFTQNRVRLQRFEREAHAASSLNHPYILTIHDIGFGSRRSRRRNSIQLAAAFGCEAAFRGSR